MRSRVIIFLLALILSSCHDATNEPPINVNVDSDTVIIFNEPSTITIKTDPVAMNDRRMNTDTLTMVVSYGGGCRKHLLQLFAHDAFLESNPVQANLYLSPMMIMTIYAKLISRIHFDSISRHWRSSTRDCIDHRPVSSCWGFISREKRISSNRSCDMNSDLKFANQDILIV